MKAWYDSLVSYTLTRMISKAGLLSDHPSLQFCRLNFFPQRWLKMPKLDIELFYFFGKINLYANMNPRANLVRPRRHSNPPFLSTLMPPKSEIHKIAAIDPCAGA